MTTWIGRTLRLFAGIGVLSAAGAPAFAQIGPPGFTPLAPLQTLEPTEQEMFPVPESPPVTLLFGAALAVDHGTALIGMPGYPDARDSGNSSEGAVAIFVEGSGSWARAGTLRANDVTAGDFFGERVALRGTLAAVQAGSGVYVFRRTPTGWSEVQKLVPPAGTRFDGGLAIGDATIFVGAPAYGAPGAVFVFESDLKGIWHPVQTLAPRNGTASDYFGGEVAVDAGTLVIGATGEFEGRGAVFIFAKRSTGWSAQQMLAPTDEPPGVSFGEAVAVSGTRIAVGAPQAEPNPNGDCTVPPAGAVYVYVPRGGLWQRQTKIPSPSAPDCSSFSIGLFGAEVSLDAAHVVAATPSLFPNQDGAIYDYRSDGAAELAAGDAPDPSLVSTPVLALSDDVLFVGLPNDRGFSTGMAEVFDLAAASSSVAASQSRPQD